MKAFISSLFLAASTLLVVNAHAVTNVERAGCVISENTVCMDSGKKQLQGLEIERDCWATQTTYQCGGIKDASDCELLADRGCTTKSVEDTCTEYLNGECLAWERTYTCTSLEESLGSETCGAVKYCEKDENGQETCYDVSYAADTDMVPVVTLLEASRQMGVYGENTFFDGEALKCSLGAYGIGQSCCFVTKTPRGRNGEMGTANSVMMSAMWEGVKYGFRYVKAIASPWVSDMWMAAKSMITGATAAAGAATGAAAGAATVGFNVSYMGFGFATAGAAPAGAISIMNTGFYFSPMGFAIAVAVYVVTQVLMCNPTDEENRLGVLRGSNLCKEIGKYCSKKTAFGICKARKRSYCCWNSVLAKIIAIEGRKQLGKGWGSAKYPDCKGFTMEEFQKLDLGKMDFSEFYKEVQPNVLGIKDSGVAKEDQDFWSGRAEERYGELNKRVAENQTGDNFADKRENMKESLSNNGSNSLKYLDTQYESGTEPQGNINVHETDPAANDPFSRF